MQDRERRPEQSRKERYDEYLLSDHWKGLKLKKFQRVGRQCQICESVHQLHGHHIRYKDFYDCETSDILILCEGCHDDLHAAGRKFHISLIDLEFPKCIDLLTAYRGQSYKSPRPKPGVEILPNGAKVYRGPMRKRKRERPALHFPVADYGQSRNFRLVNKFKKIIKEAKCGGYSISKVTAAIKKMNALLEEFNERQRDYEI